MKHRTLLSRLYGTFLSLCLLLTCIGLTACEELSQDDGVIREVLPGTWSFTYAADGDLGMELNYKLIIFNANGTCSITYDDGQLDGTYRTGDALIRIDSPDLGEDRALLWRLVSFSPYEVIATYLYEAGGQTITVTVTLTKVA